VERDLTDRPAVSPLRVGPAEIQACLEQLNALLKQDSTRANHVFRQVLEPITMTPVEDGGQRFYRATGAAKGAEMLNRLGLAQAVDFGGCGGPQPLAGTSLPVRDHGLNPCFNYDHVFAIVACGALHPQVIGVIKTRRAP
jgi:hypothetical protein